MKSGWQHKLALKITMNIQRLLDAIRKETPVASNAPKGVTSASGKYYAYTNPGRFGFLRDSMGIKKHKEGDIDKQIDITGAPYGGALEQGATIPAYFTRPGKIMMFTNKFGRAVFTNKRAGFTIQPRRFIEKAYSDWFDSNDSISVEWSGK